MDLIHDTVSVVVAEENEEEEGEDRISNLPEDIIHCVLSFLDMKDAIQTSKLSRKWRHIWTSMPHLNLNSDTFNTLPLFAKFVKHALLKRNSRTEVSSVRLTFTGVTTPFAVKSVVNYANSHNVRQLTLTWLTRKPREFPQFIFTSRTLKHLNLVSDHPYPYLSLGCYIPKSAWDFPVLETMNLRNIRVCDTDKSLNLFSKCVNLKELTMHDCSSYRLDVFNICAPKLSNLTITGHVNFAKVFKVVAPQLKSLKLTVTSTSCFNFPKMSPQGFISIEKVYLSLSVCRYPSEIYTSVLLELFQKIRNTKLLILDNEIIEALSKCPDQISNEPCPFDNLKCVKINTGHVKQKDRIAPMPTIVRNYFLENSPTTTFIMDLPQVSRKRSRQQVNDDAMANKVAKLEAEKQQAEVTAEEKRALEAKIQMQDEVILEQKATVDALKLQHDKLTSHIIKCKMSELKVHVESGNPDCRAIRSIGREFKSVMELIPESSRANADAQFYSQYEELKNLYLTHIDASQWVTIETELGFTSGSATELPSAQTLQSCKAEFP